MNTLADALLQRGGHAGSWFEKSALRRYRLAMSSMTIAQAMSVTTEHHRGGRFAEAEAIYRQILAQNPDFAEGHFALGNVLADAGRLDEAIDAFRQATRLQSDFVEAYNNLGTVLTKRKRHQEAIEAYQQVLRLAPKHFKAFNNLGVVLWEIGQLDNALAASLQAIVLKPDFADAHNSLGIVLRAKKDFNGAVAAFSEALRLRPDFVEAYSNLGNAMIDQGRLEDAVAACRQALRINPNYPPALNNLGVALRASGQIDQAIAVYRRHIELHSDDPAAHFNLGTALLTKGRLEEGWRENEYRQQVKEFSARCRVCAQPRWDGGELHGRRILLDVEQGLGDTIQFVRYAPLLASRGGRVILAAQPELTRLLQSAAGVEQVVPRDSSPAFDVHYPLLSLPYALGTGLDSIPADIPYLKTDPAIAEAWERRLGPRDRRLRVGLAWAGHPDHARDRERSISLAQLAPLASASDVVFYSLQKGPAASQAAARPGMELIDFTGDIQDFADTAGLISQLDLVICVDTAVAHLAGAMAKPVWVLVPFVPDWRWMLDRDNSPWYPTMRLFRQKTRGGWDEVVRRIALALENKRAGA